MHLCTFATQIRCKRSSVKKNKKTKHTILTNSQQYYIHAIHAVVQKFLKPFPTLMFCISIVPDTDVPITTAHMMYFNLYV